MERPLPKNCCRQRFCTLATNANGKRAGVEAADHSFFKCFSCLMLHEHASIHLTLRYSEQPSTVLMDFHSKTPTLRIRTAEHWYQSTQEQHQGIRIITTVVAHSSNRGSTFVEQLQSGVTAQSSMQTAAISGSAPKLQSSQVAHCKSIRPHVHLASWPFMLHVNATTSIWIIHCSRLSQGFAILIHVQSR